MNIAKRIVYFGSVFVLTASISAWGEDETAIKQSLFEKVFDDAVRLDSDQVKTVVSSPPGKRHYIDRDGDGRPEEVWFIDTALRHPERYRPLLVRAIDEDGDLQAGHEPDLDSDLYVADWGADGIVDAVLDYTDADGDNDLDEMGAFFYGGTHGYFDEPVIRVWWSRDVGDDNLLWHDVGYTYDQTLCQYRTHFGGDEELIAFSLPLSGSEWIPFFENPFLFYDHDGDGVTEEVLRMSGIAREVECIRHSFDADNDATMENPRDFDVSLTSWMKGANWTSEGRGRGRSQVTFDGWGMDSAVIRGFPTTPFLAFRAAPRFAAQVVPERMMLTWDEIDWNVDGQNHADENERWEGIIANGNDRFPQVGGPSAGPVNKRYEIVMKPTAPARLYYHPTDHRLHLHSTDSAWLEADTDLDRKADVRYDMRDTNRDGIIDRWELDTDLDGTPDDVWNAGAVEIKTVGWNWAEIHTAITTERIQVLLNTLALHQRLYEACRLHRSKISRVVLGIYDDTRSPAIVPATPIPVPRLFIEKLKWSDERLLYDLTVWNDRWIAELKPITKDRPFWKAFNTARSLGDLTTMTKLLENEIPSRKALWIPNDKSLQLYRSNNPYQPQPPRAAWAEDWVPPNIGWESDRVAYRMYWGQFDFFGKKKNGLIYPDIAGKSYHDENEWGIDALLVGKSPGCGGVTLYAENNVYPIWNPEGKGDIVFEKKLHELKNDEVTIEVLASKIVPGNNPYTVRLRCTAFSGRMETKVEVRVDTKRPLKDVVFLGIGLTSLPQESLLLNTDVGVFGSWGVQTPVIGPIGMGIVFPHGNHENQLVLRIEPGVPLVYYIRCDWLRGRRFDRSPSANDWLNVLTELAAEVRKS